LRERLGKGRGLARPGRALKLVKHTKFKWHPDFSLSPRTERSAALVIRPGCAAADGARASECRSMTV
jgi:hypothetical protein